MEVGWSERFQWSRANNPWWRSWKRDLAYPLVAGALSAAALAAFGYEAEVRPTLLVIAVTALTFLFVPLIGFVTGVLRAPTELRNAKIQEQASELNRLQYLDSGLLSSASES